MISRSPKWVLAILLIPLLGMIPQPQSARSDEDVVMSDSAVGAFLRDHCLECHNAQEAESGLDLSAFSNAADITKAVAAWTQIATRVGDRQMPPKDSKMPEPETRARFVRWIQSTLSKHICDDGVTAGQPVIRRMNRTEYANTVRDLLGIPINAGHALPNDGAGGEGFDNAAEILFISPIYAEKYLQAAKSAIGHALKDPADRKRIIVASPKEEQTPDQAARIVLRNFLPRAFRRPVSSIEIDEYAALFNKAFAVDQTYDSAVEFALVAAMVSPKFLFLYEQPTAPGEQTLVSHHEMASRLSYFLWASMPDQELMGLANEKKLHDVDVLTTQVKRMLRSEVDSRGLRRDSKVRGFASSFIEQWLGTRALGREFKPDASVAPRYDSELEGGMKYEPIFFFEDLLSDNRSLLNLIDSDFTYVNRRLANHYGVRGEFREQPKRVELKESDRRGGLLGMGAVLAVSSLPHRTSPVLRGKWILDTMLGTPPPPPPPDVPVLEDATDRSGKFKSLRVQLETHRSNPTCASCHNTMDPLGFGLENYDVLGSWRTEEGGVPIDASGSLPDGKTFDGPKELKQMLLDRKDQFVRNLARKMLGYALGRSLTAEDYCVIDSIVEKLAMEEYRTQTLIIEIVKSVPFRYKQITLPAK
jgi:mono/diheme cytochrome c family protein